MSKQNEKSNIHKGTIIVLCCSGAVIIALVVVIVVLLTHSGKEEKQKRNVVITPDNVAKVLEELDEHEFVPIGSYEVTMNNEWHFKNGTAASDNAYVENALSNTNAVCFDVVLADTEERIYSSPVLPLGSHIENITLDKELPEGTYDCVIIYTLVDDDQNNLSSVRVKMTVIVDK